LGDFCCFCAIWFFLKKSDLGMILVGVFLGVKKVVKKWSKSGKNGCFLLFFW